LGKNVRKPQGIFFDSHCIIIGNRNGAVRIYLKSLQNKLKGKPPIFNTFFRAYVHHNFTTSGGKAKDLPSLAVKSFHNNICFKRPHVSRYLGNNCAKSKITNFSCSTPVRRPLFDKPQQKSYTYKRHMLKTHFICHIFLSLIIKVKVKNVKADIALHGNPISELRDVTCHMGSYSVTCHPTQVNAPRLTPAMQAGIRFPNL